MSKTMLENMACLSYNWLPDVASLYKHNLSMILRCGLFFFESITHAQYPPWAQMWMLPFRCWANLEEMLLFLKARWCSLYRLEKFLPLWPTYTFPQSAEFNLYKPMARYLLVLWTLGFRFNSIAVFFL